MFDLLALNRTHIGKKPNGEFRINWDYAGIDISSDSGTARVGLVDFIGGNASLKRQDNKLVPQTSTNLPALKNNQAVFSGSGNSHLLYDSASDRIIATSITSQTLITRGVFNSYGVDNSFGRIFDSSSAAIRAFWRATTSSLRASFVSTNIDFSFTPIAGGTYFVVYRNLLNLRKVDVFSETGLHIETKSITVGITDSPFYFGNSDALDRALDGTIDLIVNDYTAWSDDKLERFVKNPYRFLENAPTVSNDAIYAALFPVSAAPGITVVLGLASEINISNSIDKLKSKVINQISEFNLAFGTGRIKSRTLGPVNEINLSQQVSKLKEKELGLISELNLAQQVSTGLVKLLGLSNELDSSQSVTKNKLKQIAQVNEINEAQQVSTGVVKLLGQAIELDTSRPVTKSKIKEISRALETDVAQGITTGQAVTVGIVSEVNSAVDLAVLKVREVGQASEIDSAFIVVVPKEIGLGVAGEVDTAFDVEFIEDVFRVVAPERIYTVSPVNSVYKVPPSDRIYLVRRR